MLVCPRPTQRETEQVQSMAPDDSSSEDEVEPIELVVSGDQAACINYLVPLSKDLLMTIVGKSSDVLKASL